MANSNETEHQKLIRPGCIEQTSVQSGKGNRELRERDEAKEDASKSDSPCVSVWKAIYDRHLDEDAHEGIILDNDLFQVSSDNTHHVRQLSGSLIEYCLWTGNKFTTFIIGAPDYRLLDFCANIWICKTASEEPIATIIA
ncbi:unnamed protein product [Hymenolepis diminuta]|uniref:Uncharacterized protein n=1 Tax=Hymenolepis diminuta TaxID=6216 RepID=A0A564YG53_HYMDI|nr:unnamed protein product [Hymenolepis diminuta]